MNKYLEMKERHQKQFNEFEGIFFAFDKKQFEEGLQKVGFKKGEDKLVNIGNGGYCLKSRIDLLEKTCTEQQDELVEAMLNDDEFCFDAFYYELGNHEYCITHDYEDALGALDLTLDEVFRDTRLRGILKNAEAKYLKEEH